MGAGERFNLRFVTHCVTIEMIKIDKIIWDEWNIEHIGRHNVTQPEVEEVFFDRNYVVRESYRKRLKIIGKTKKGRFLLIVVHEDSENIYYIITARDADKEEQNEKD